MRVATSFSSSLARAKAASRAFVREATSCSSFSRAALAEAASLEADFASALAFVSAALVSAIAFSSLAFSASSAVTLPALVVSTLANACESSDLCCATILLNSSA